MWVIYLLDIFLIMTCWFRIQVHNCHFCDKHHTIKLDNVISCEWIHSVKKNMKEVWFASCWRWMINLYCFCYLKISSCETRQKVIIKLVSSAVAPNIYCSKSLRCCTQSLTDWWLQQIWPLLSIMEMAQLRRDFSRRAFR